MRRWLPLLVLVGCAERGAWDDVRIDEAHLDGFDLTSVTVVLGVVGGDALLVFSGPDGDGALPVHLGGPVLGAALDITADVEGHDGPVDIDLSDVDDPTVGDALGTYVGTTIGGAVIAGGSRRRLKNGRGASFREDHFALGLGLFAGIEWVTISEGGDDGSSTATRPFPTGDTGHSAAPPTFTTTTTTTPTTTGPYGTDGTGATGGSGGSGCGCGDGSDGCGDASGCGCSHGALAPGLAWVGVLLRRRRSTGRADPQSR